MALYPCVHVPPNSHTLELTLKVKTYNLSAQTLTTLTPAFLIQYIYLSFRFILSGRSKKKTDGH